MAQTPKHELTAKQEDARQLISGPQRHTLLVGGSRSGKTFVATRQVVVRAIKAPETHHAIFRLRYNALRASIWLGTLPKVMRLCFPNVRLDDHRQDGFTELPNGSQLWFVGLDDQERVEKVLGLEFATLYYNECSQIPYSSIVTSRTRLAEKSDLIKNRAFYDLNPVGKGHWTYREFFEHVNPESRRPLATPDDYKYLFMNPVDNRANIDEKYLQSLEEMSSRAKKRFLEGVYAAEIEGALWTVESIETLRRDQGKVPPLKRIVVAVDPSGCSGNEDYRSDEIGIVVAGVADDGHGYVLADKSCRGSPEEWARIAVRAYHDFKADRIVFEKNFGGDMVRAVIHGADSNVPTQEVNASRGKVVRAEPISALYERSRVHHVGEFPVMEAQMLDFSTAGYKGERSPDRADALVWALSAVMLDVADTAVLDSLRAEVKSGQRREASGNEADRRPRPP